MIDPELSALLEFMPKIDLSDAVAARAAFEETLAAMRVEIPGVGALDIEDIISRARGRYANG